jgi:hypothetical protein
MAASKQRARPESHVEKLKMRETMRNNTLPIATPRITRSTSDELGYLREVFATPADSNPTNLHARRIPRVDDQHF